MDQVSIEAAEALSGEEAFILQLRPPAPPGADEAALAERIDQFARLYLAAAEPERARFAQLAPLTWAIAASRFDAGRIEQLRADLCETLFGRDDEARAQLARQPAEPDLTNCVNHPSAASRAAFDDDSDTFDLDAAALNLDDSDVFEVDAWRLDEPSAAGAGHGPLEPVEDDSEMEPAPDAVASEETDGDVLSALAELERAFTGDAAPQDEAEPPAEAWNEAIPAPQDDGFDVNRFEADLDAFEAEAARNDAAPEAFGDDDWTPAAPAAPEPDDSFESLTEAPSPRAGDLAAELAAFREEMRAIAGSIPGGGSGEALAQFRDEVEAVAGALGQRVDGAAQRIEAAAERISAASSPDAAERITGAAARAEQSASLMETSVREAVAALKAVLDAAGGAQAEAANGA